MAKKKEQKKKERERRVAKKKHAATLKKNEDKGTDVAAKFGPKGLETTTGAPLPKPSYVASAIKKPINYRRGGG